MTKVVIFFRKRIKAKRRKKASKKKRVFERISSKETKDSDGNLVFKVSEITSKEVAATGIDWTFSPCLSSPEDYRWGRTYEGF